MFTTLKYKIVLTTKLKGVNMKNILCASVLFIFSSNLFANCDAESCVGVKVTRMYVTANGDTKISTSGDESRLSCNAGRKGYIALDPNSKNYKATYSLLLTAHTTDHPIWVTTSTSGPCNVIYVVSDK
jgi:hypothetical protein